jgi:hypothetical protein
MGDRPAACACSCPLHVALVTLPPSAAAGSCRCRCLAAPGPAACLTAAPGPSATAAPAALEQLGQLAPGMTVLVTAAAGGTGQFAVQLAKLAGCHVVATCSSEAKAQLLRSLGADRVLNHRTQDLKQQLRQHYPKVRGRGQGGRGWGVQGGRGGGVGGGAGETAPELRPPLTPCHLAHA